MLNHNHHFQMHERNRFGASSKRVLNNPSSGLISHQLHSNNMNAENAAINNGVSSGLIKLKDAARVVLVPEYIENTSHNNSNAQIHQYVLPS